MLKVHFKPTHKNAILPRRAHSDPLTGDTGYDIFACEEVKLYDEVDVMTTESNINLLQVPPIPGIGTSIPGIGTSIPDTTKVKVVKHHVIVPTGINVAYITPGYWFRIEAKSGLGFRYHVTPHFGVIDNCVPAGTLIETINGSVPIENIHNNIESENKLVYSYNEERNNKEIDKITETWVVNDVDLLEIETEDGIVQVPLTKELYTKRGWVQAQNLTLEDTILTFS